MTQAESWFSLHGTRHVEYLQVAGVIWRVLGDKGDVGFLKEKDASQAFNTKKPHPNPPEIYTIRKGNPLFNTELKTHNTQNYFLKH